MAQKLGKMRDVSGLLGEAISHLTGRQALRIYRKHLLPLLWTVR